MVAQMSNLKKMVLTGDTNQLGSYTANVPKACHTLGYNSIGPGVGRKRIPASNSKYLRSDTGTVVNTLSLLTRDPLSKIKKWAKNVCKLLLLPFWKQKEFPQTSEGR